MRIRILAVALLVLALILPASVGRVAAEVLDQSQEVGGEVIAFYQPQGCPSAGVKAAAQTFTAGLSGLLTRVDLLLAKTSWTTDAQGITVEIHAAQPDGALLATSSTALASVVPFEPDYAWVSLTFGAPATVSAGQAYAIVLPPDIANTSSYDPTFRWPGTDADSYVAGVTWDYYCPLDQWQAYVFGSDRTFRTYVAPLITPTARQTWGALKSMYR